MPVKVVLGDLEWKFSTLSNHAGQYLRSVLWFIFGRKTLESFLES